MKKRNLILDNGATADYFRPQKEDSLLLGFRVLSALYLVNKLLYKNREEITVMMEVQSIKATPYVAKSLQIRK